MKVLVINGYEDNSQISLDQSIFQIIKERCQEKDYTIEKIDLVNQDIKKCVGCFGCWIKTPGQCVIQDDGNALAKAYINSDIVIILSKLSFGGYSPITKKAMERTVSLISPHFEKKNGVTYHKKRYETYPEIIAIGLLADSNPAEEELFFQLVKKNALNFSAPKSKSYILYEHQCDMEIDERLERIFEDDQEVF